MGKAKSNQEWWHEKVDQLAEQAKQFTTVDPDVIYEKDGLWPVIKLVWMKQALGIYAPIMSRARENGQWGSLHLIDLCAGSGLTRLRGADHKGKTLTVTGSALIAAHDSRFDFYHFVEPGKKQAKALEQRLALKLPPGKFKVYPTTCKEALPLILKDLKENWKNPHSMAFIDPEGVTETPLPELEPLLRFGRGDILFNYQYTGVKRAGQANADAFFGDPNWPANGSWEDVRNFFLKRLAHYGRPKSTVINVAAGEGHGPYAYDMVYCAAETKAGNPWLQNLESDIERRMQGMTGAFLEDVIFGGQTRLF
ncbi:MAG TPA: three-Cys-motif partner protein TcmP [Candidatus Thermoplasmatota archaeon]|nr:three-Cys-motif partner protein TcmP [Candidatus Thermoplasmatota archaeon]